MPLTIRNEQYHTLEEYYALPEEVRVELIDGVFYDMASPSQIHQEISRELEYSINEYIRNKKGKCSLFHSPFDVKLFDNKDDIVQPDIFVVCDRDKLDGKRCNGAPDWVIEIASPSNVTHDYVEKLSLYDKAGVREYWIVNPDDKSVVVYRFDSERPIIDTFSFEDTVKVGIYNDFRIDFRDVMSRVNG